MIMSRGGSKLYSGRRDMASKLVESGHDEQKLIANKFPWKMNP
jgi:hypothetical protein